MNDEFIIRNYVKLIRKGKMTIESVPERWQEEVRKELEK